MTVTINGTSGVTTPGVANTGNETITGNLAVTGAATAASLQVGGVTTNVYPVVTGTSQASTSGSTIDFTSIPSWVKRITVLFKTVSMSSTSDILVQIGSSGTPVTTGYSSGSGRATGTSASGTNSTAGFNIYFNAGAAVVDGAMVIYNYGSNIWVASHAVGYSTGGAMGGGSVTLSGTLDIVRIKSAGADTFDLGSINILYE